MKNNPDRVLSPVYGVAYKSFLSKQAVVGSSSAKSFFMQWYAFSAFMPELLAELIVNADSEIEKINLVKNLYSELGLDTNTESHPKMLRSLIENAYGEWNEQLIERRTESFIDDIATEVRKGDSAYNAGLVLALEEVAYDILDVLKEVLRKSGNSEFLKHPYIAIHEQVESEHIAHTKEIVSQYSCANAGLGYQEMMEWWGEFWNNAFICLAGDHA